MARLDAQPVRLRVVQKDEAARDALRLAEQLQGAAHRAPEVRRVGERAPDFEQRRQPLLRVRFFCPGQLREAAGRLQGVFHRMTRREPSGARAPAGKTES